MKATHDRRQVAPGPPRAAPQPPATGSARAAGMARAAARKAATVPPGPTSTLAPPPPHSPPQPDAYYKVRRRPEDGKFNVVTPDGTVVVGGLDTEDEAAGRAEAQQASRNRHREREARQQAAQSAPRSVFPPGVVPGGLGFAGTAVGPPIGGMGNAASSFVGPPLAGMGMGSASPTAPGATPGPSAASATGAAGWARVASGAARWRRDPATGWASQAGKAPTTSAFERGFDASIGRVIAGFERVVTSAASAFSRGAIAYRTQAQARGGLGSVAPLSGIGANAAGTLGLGRAFAAGFRKMFPGAGTPFVGPPLAGKGSPFVGPPLAGKGSPNRAARRAARGFARIAKARRRSVWGAYRKARGVGASRGAARGFAGVVGAGAKVAGMAELAGVAGFAGAIGTATRVVLAAGQKLKDTAESKLDDNRRLAPYSSKLSLGFSQLALGDQSRDIRLARSAGESGLALAQAVNGLREGTLGFDKLRLATGNRIGLAAAALVGPAYRELGRMAGGLADGIEKGDPAGKKGTWGEQLINNFHDGHAAAFAWYRGLIGSWGSLTEANRLAMATMEDLARERAKGVAPVLDAWSEFIAGAQSLPKAVPARPLKP